jgi:diacylglycerol kinase family enzyme
MSVAMKHLFVLNPKSFWNQWKMEQVRSKIHEFFKTLGSQDYAIHVSRFPRDATGYVSGFIRMFPQETIIRVYAVGGDGILFDCLNAVIPFPNAELAAIPYGFKNTFLYGFGKANVYLFRDIRRQVEASTIPLDVIRCGSHYAISFCAMGIESEAHIRAEKIREQWAMSGHLFRWLAKRLYIQLCYLGGILAIFDKKITQQRYEIDIDGEMFDEKFSIINIANSAWYAGSLSPQRRARPDDGVLDVFIGRSMNKWNLIRRVRPYLKGRYSREAGDFYILERARKITIRSQDPIFIDLDDIQLVDTNITVEVLPGAIRFVDVAGQGYWGEGYWEESND